MRSADERLCQVSREYRHLSSAAQRSLDGGGFLFIFHAFFSRRRACVYVLHSSSFVAAAKLVFVSYEELGAAREPTVLKRYSSPPTFPLFSLVRFRSVKGKRAFPLSLWDRVKWRRISIFPLASALFFSRFYPHPMSKGFLRLFVSLQAGILPYRRNNNRGRSSIN